MANLQVKGIDDYLYQALRIRAKNRHRSISQEVIKLIEDSLNRPDESANESTQQFLSLSWASGRSDTAEKLITTMRKNRKESKRFTGAKSVFD